MKRLFIALLFAFFSINAYACALCAAYTPTTHISVGFKANKDKIESISFEWSFSKEFNDMLLQNYDFNDDKNLDTKEQKAIKAALIDYVLPRNHLTQVFVADDDTLKPAKFKLKSYEATIKNNELSYRYELGVSINADERFGLKVQDDEGFFAFYFLQPEPFALENGYLVGNLNANVINFSKVQALPSNANQNNAPQSPKKELTNQKSLDNAPLKQDTNTQNSSLWDKFWQKALALNAKFIALIKAYINGESGFMGFLALMGVSFAYGIFHASAPGHAKLLTSSYFLAHKSSYTKAFSFALKVGIVHILSAFLLVSIALVVLKVVVQSLANNANVIITQISSTLIVFVALFLLSKKILKPHSKGCSCPACKGQSVINSTTQSHLKTNIAQNNLNFRSQNATKKGTNFATIPFKKADFSELAIVVAAGIVPCPTMVLVFLLAYEVSFSAALLSAVCIALGMTCVVFVAAVVAHKVRLSAKTQRVSNALEYFALLFMLALGAFIFFNAQSGVF